MPLIDGKWHVVRGDCMWDIAAAVYGNGRKWPTIADANGVPRKNPVIYVGQVFTIPGITTPTPVPEPAPQPPAVTTPNIEWFALDAGTSRSMFCVWSFDRANTKHYEVNWDYDTGQGGWRIGSHGTTTDKQSGYSAPEEAKKVRVSIKPISDSWSDGQAVVREYNFSDNPPELPPDPTFQILSNNVLECEIQNIQEGINADTLEFAIYQDDSYKYKTGTATINMETRYCKFTTDVDPGHKYKVRIRSIRNSNIYSGWSDFTENLYSTPLPPTDIIALRATKNVEQQTEIYGIYVEWDDVPSAKTYLVQWVTNIELFDTGQEESQQTEEGQGPKLHIYNIDLGHEYFFRVASINDRGQSIGYSEIRSIRVGTRPQAPTTWSNVSQCVIGDQLNLYWVHNSSDDSLETEASIHFIVKDQSGQPVPDMTFDVTVYNEKPVEEQDRTSVYTIDTENPTWLTLSQGYAIYWKVKTRGVADEFSDYSVERVAYVYAKPEITVDTLNSSGDQAVSIDEINHFPFYIAISSEPHEQTPISYYVEIIANDSYETVDDIGNVKMVSAGDKIYTKYYDPKEGDKWNFLLEMTPGNVDLDNDKSYTINATVSMNSGLTATDSKDFTVYFDEVFYDVYGNVIFNKETYEASIHPYCNEFEEVSGEIVSHLVENCTLSVYRREYDGTFTLIQDNIPNEDDLYITDPHPSLDYARYRIVAKTNDTGAISYVDLPGVKIKNPAVIIQWAEKWSSFNVDDEGTNVTEPAWSGSMLILPYNISINESKALEVSLVNYAGREYPVSYYGTHIGETASWSVDIPKEDKETIYAIRRLSRWKGDVYVREPSGTGYWANINVAFGTKYSDIVIPISFTITRVEGGI